MTRVASPRMARTQHFSDAHDDDRHFRALDRILARTLVRELMRHRARAPSRGTLRPRMDLCDDPANADIVATLELPGLKQEDVSVRIERGLLVVQGERRFRSLARAPSRSLAPSPRPGPDSGPDAQDPAAPSQALVRAQSAEPHYRLAWADARPDLPHAYATQEIKYGTFQRTLALPPGTQVGHVRASLAEGMLTLSWPRHPLADPGHDAARPYETGGC
ncbi:HSP20-like chaperone [Daedalea quercina L-15889]|uniref:HSP20-like chaperone n=1 Tax=Daedalea quercina L-15889 TaxID=1314783 RepID=A0A165L9S4_9APHY|nr:HSP20-like chaperone [Daedalea quercina L-15889]